MYSFSFLFKSNDTPVVYGRREMVNRNIKPTPKKSKQEIEEQQQTKFIARCVIIFILVMLMYWAIWWIRKLF